MNGSASLHDSIEAELELRARRRQNRQLIAPTGWREWTTTLFPRFFRYDFAQHHIDLWEWVENIQKGVKPKVFIGIWDRGGAKSTSAETAVVRIGSKGVRRYGLYVSSTQVKADGHVMTIGAMLESKPYANYYSKMSSRAVNQYGSSKGWKHNRLITKSGFALDAFGLDSGLRGAKIEDARPDFIIIDDVDEQFDSVSTTLKKIGVITNSILPAGSDDCAILFIQNLIAPDSIASRLVDGRADFMRNRILSGPHPAVKNLEYEWDSLQERFIVTGGEPTWSARSLDDVQSKIDDWGLSSYLREAQHEVEHTGGIWDHIEWVHTTFDDLPSFKEVCVAVDPAVTSTDESDSQGISIGGKTMDNHLIGLYFWEGIDTPEGALERAIYEGYKYGARYCLVETNQGGDTWESVYANACKKVIERLIKEWHSVNVGVDIRRLPAFTLPRFKGDKAGAGDGPKIERNQQLLPLYETGRVRHMLGTHKMIEKALRRFPVKPLDLADSWWWCAKELDLIGTRMVRAFGVRS
ncbi:MAG: hypothetical protein ABIO63_09300 [Casimicrobiaceae bacterium]